MGLHSLLGLHTGETDTPHMAADSIVAPTARWMGHATIKTTAIYTNRILAALRLLIISALCFLNIRTFKRLFNNLAWQNRDGQYHQPAPLDEFQHCFREEVGRDKRRQDDRW